jgi:heterodisulfide reductase subunit A
MRNKKVAVIGGGIAGMEAAGQLAAMGHEVILLEKGNKLGGHVAGWHQLFPDRKPAKDIISSLKNSIHEKVEIYFGAELYKLQNNNGTYNLSLTDGQNFDVNAMIVATGFDLFNASKKEEYGYGIYDNVITSAELEEKFNSGKPIKTLAGAIPKRIAFIHCVGSRDEKAGNTYCSKVCCVTGVKQAIELKQAIPDAEIYSFYMDLRMYDRYFEDIYYEAQSKYGIRFIRGRLSEACENQDGSIILKAEDTLIGKPIKMTVDLMVLLVGMVSSKGTCEISDRIGISRDKDNFLKTIDNHSKLNFTGREGIFTCGTCTGPKSVSETLADARSAALLVSNYLSRNIN